MNQQEAELARVTLELLKRVDIKGGEVPTFNVIEQWLSGKMQAAQQTDEVEDPREEVPVN